MIRLKKCKSYGIVVWGECHEEKSNPDVKTEEDVKTTNSYFKEINFKSTEDEDLKVFIKKRKLKKEQS